MVIKFAQQLLIINLWFSKLLMIYDNNKAPLVTLEQFKSTKIIAP